VFSHIIVDYLFVFSVIVIWFMLAYQFILFLLGYLYGFRIERQRRKLENVPLELPAVSLMIPAHNEGMVISYTLEALLKLDYPSDRLEILVINDGARMILPARWRPSPRAMHACVFSMSRQNLRYEANLPL
jgi:cellulose synthase/poly-beta-1,6-N-acetylglucosamine synthase-like glycosyltransferase